MEAWARHNQTIWQTNGDPTSIQEFAGATGSAAMLRRAADHPTTTLVTAATPELAGYENNYQLFARTKTQPTSQHLRRWRATGDPSALTEYIAAKTNTAIRARARISPSATAIQGHPPPSGEPIDDYQCWDCAPCR